MAETKMQPADLQGLVLCRKIHSDRLLGGCCGHYCYGERELQHSQVLEQLFVFAFVAGIIEYVRHNFVMGQIIF